MSEGPVIITLRDVYDQVVGLKEAVGEAPRIIKDHEDRIRALEKRVWGWTALSGGGGGILGAVLTQLFNGGGG